MPYCATGGRATQTPMLGSDRAVHRELVGVKLIVNADDFGRNNAINAAVGLAHDQGILTSASLMVSENAAADAVQVARDRPSLAVGLHLVLLGGRATLDPAEIPHLANEDGLFARSPVRTGLRYFFSPDARRELAREIRAQFEAFKSTALPLSHVDGHHHMHLHPTVFRLLLPLAREYGASGIRVSVSDELFFSIRQDRSHVLLKLGWKIAFSLLGLWARRLLRRERLPAADRVYGLMQSGAVTESYLICLVNRLRQEASVRGLARTPCREPVFEVFCHPSQGQDSRDLGPNPGDLSALLSPVVRTAVAANGVLLTTYAKALRTPPGEPAAEDTARACPRPTGSLPD
jgi:hopanoid biosynthesis associated protein HpnK